MNVNSLGQSPPTTWAERLRHASFWRREVKRSFGDNISHMQLLESLQYGNRQLGPVLIGLGSLPSRDAPIQTLVYVELNDAQNGYLEMKPLLNVDDFGLVDDTKRPSAEMTLYFERTRSQIWNGVMAYTVHQPSKRLLVTTTNGIFVYMKGTLRSTADWCSGECMNAAFCPAYPDYIAFSSRGQLYIDSLNKNVFTTASDDSVPGITNGVASFVVQEELERDQGFWWNPKSLSLVYERVDSRVVTELAFVVPGKPPQEPMRYPLCGTENAKSHLHLVIYDTRTNRFVDRPLLTFIEKFVPDYEYIACAGWVDDGESFYVIVMNRCQTKRSILLIGKEAFTFSSCEPRDLPIRILYEEESGVWINNNQLTLFSSSTADSILQLIYGSEKSDLCHLYMRSFQFGDALPEEFSITAGDWTVVKEVKPTLDLKRKHIYYLANVKSPLATALCVSSYGSPFCQQHSILTPADLCYKFDRAYFDLHVKPDLGFVCWLSSIKQLPECHFYTLVHSADRLLPTSQILYRIRLQPAIASPIQGKSLSNLKSLEVQTPKSTQSDVSMSPVSSQPDPSEQLLVPESLFTHEFRSVLLEDGYTAVQCLVLLPVSSAGSTKKFPVIHYVYAGPGSQVVRNSWIGVSQFLKFLTAGYAIFLCDSRGSCNRGIRFESAIKHHMGSVEVNDQVYALKYVAKHYFPMLDLNRVGVTGWSYGGYMALQMMSQHAPLYKCSIPAGAVVDWDLYDTAYTERYMGRPGDHADQYKNSSVLSRIASLPDEEDRLLIIHGLIDENVHFHHTEKLINALINAGKPHKLLIFPNERHGVRKAESVEYLHASMLSFFDQNLKQ